MVNIEPISSLFYHLLLLIYFNYLLRHRECGHLNCGKLNAINYGILQILSLFTDLLSIIVDT